MMERWFRSRKEACVWHHAFHSFREAQRVIRQWITWYDAERPHQALGHQSPSQYRAQQLNRVA